MLGGLIRQRAVWRFLQRSADRRRRFATTTRPTASLPAASKQAWTTALSGTLVCAGPLSNRRKRRKPPRSTGQYATWTAGVSEPCRSM